jgi:hypothetical protein
VTPLLVEAIEALATQPRVKPEGERWWATPIRVALHPAAEYLARKRRARESRATGIESPRTCDRVIDLVMRAGTPLASNAIEATYACVHAQYRAAYGNQFAGPLPAWAPENGPPDPNDDKPEVVIRWLTARAFELLPEAPLGSQQTQSVFWDWIERSIVPLFTSNAERFGSQTPVPWLTSAGKGDARQALAELHAVEVLLALQYSEVLSGFRRSAGRQVVWQIGGDIGQLASRLVSLHRDTTYILIDHVEHLIASAVYLTTAMPLSTLQFLSSDGVCGQQPATPHFVLVPLGLSSTIELPRPELTLVPDLCVRLRIEDVEATLGRAHALGCRFVYSRQAVGRLDGAVEIELGRMLRRYYWTHPFSLLGDKGRIVAKRAATKAGVPARLFDSSHLIGWKRIVA